MNCSNCENLAVFSNPDLCKDHFIDYFEKNVRDTISKHNLVSKSARIAVAVSGGKDSLFLLEAMALLKNHIPFHFNLKAVHIEVDDAPYEIDKDG